MRVSYTAIAVALAAVANGQTLPDIPSCALNCFVTAFTGDGCVALTDFACHCGKAGLEGKITPCVESACPVSDQAKVATIVTDTCAQAGVPISLSATPGETTSAAVTSATSAAATTSPATTTTVATTSVVATTSQATNPIVSTTSRATTAVSNITSVRTSTSVAGSFTSSVGSVTSSITSRATSSTSARPSTYTGGVGSLKAGSGAFAAVVMGAAYML